MPKIILFNKPFQVISQFSGDTHHTLKEYLLPTGFYPAGRLDKDSEGLLILTDDGPLQHRLSHPSHQKEKKYWVQVEGIPTQDDLDKLRQGITLNDGPCLPIEVCLIQEPPVWSRVPPVRERKSIPTQWLALSLHEGRNRQIRRMTAAIGFPTLRLIRHQIDKWSLDNLQPGQHKMESVSV